MGEQDAIDRSSGPVTHSSLVADLRRLGVQQGATLMVHSSLARLGFVVGGPQTVVEALLETIGPDGTLVMPTHSSDVSDPAWWQNPPVPETWWDTIRAEMPAYDPARTPTRLMGSIVEYFRTLPGVLRSANPVVSAAALGPNADRITAGHEFERGLGETSPQARIYDLDGSILLLGVTHANNTSLHLAEHRSAPPNAATIGWSAPMVVDGERRWVTAPNLVDDPSDFAEIGEAFAATGREVSGPVGAGTGRLMRSRDLVDFAVAWMNERRTWTATSAEG